jgi:hypothetical protein
MEAVIGFLIVATALAAKVVPPQADKMFPDGRAHDFGKVPRGMLVSHSFRIANTLGVPLRIVSLRRS